MKKWLLLAGLLLVTATWVTAAESAEALRLSLPQAVALALVDNPDFVLARHRQQSAAISVEATRGRYLPSLQGSVGASENYQHQTAPGVPDQQQNADLQLTASINLFNGFADQAALDASRQQLQAADADLLRQRQILTFTVASRFITVLSDDELVQVAAQNLKNQQDLEQQIEAFQRAGVRSVTDLYQQQAATAQAEFNLVDARRNLQVAKLQLLQTLGRTPPTTIEVLPPGTQAFSAELENLDPGRIYAESLASRPDLLAQQRQIDAARQQIRVARAGYLPSLDLQATGGTGYSSAGNGSFSGQLDDNRGASLGLKLSIPIFDRDQTRTNVAQAQLSVADAATTLHKLQQQIGLEVGQALADYQRARQQLFAVGRQLDYARQALAASEARYRVGAMTWIEAANARTVYVQAQGDEIRARYSVLLQGLNVGFSRGDLEKLMNLLATQESSL